MVVETGPEGCVAKRKGAYYSNVSNRSDFRSRLGGSGAARGRLLDLGARKTA